MTDVSHHLTQFYRELQAWIDGGCGEHPVFEPKWGLCHNLSAWSLEHDLPWAILTAMSDDLQIAFEAAGLYAPYPFNDGCQESYDQDDKYTNPARLAWIKAHAEQAEGVE